MRKRLAVAVGVMAAASGLTANAIADVTSVFDASGLFANGSILGGTMTIDTTTGVLTAADLTLTGIGAGTYSIIDTTGYSSVFGIYQTFVGQTANPFVDSLRLGVLAPNLMGFSGGNFDSLAHHSPTNYVSDYENASSTASDLVSGSLTRAPVPVARAPEIDPASAGSALTLLLGSLALLRGRKRTV